MKTDENIQTLNDEELVTKISTNNNTLLFGILYDRYSNVVYNKCLSFARDTDEAQDLMQDVFLKLFVKLGSFQGKSKFSTWLYAFTYNHCVNFVTRDTAKKMEKKSISIEDDNTLYIEVDDSSLFQLRVDKLRKALDIIPPDDKMILLLKYQDDASIKEIASSLSLGESAVKMRLKRAKAQVVQICNKID